MVKRVGLLGGTFNPPHLGHLIIANEVLHQFGLDEVRFMPAGIPPHKQIKGDTSSEQRKEMVIRAIDNHTGFVMETIELEKEGPSYTYETIKLLVEREPQSEFHFIIGGDMIDYLPKWHMIEELSRLIQFVGVKRPGYETESPFNVIMADVPQIEISSTMIRDRIAAGKTVNYLIPEEVLDYIREEKLYGKG
ncbi:nicotinate-nucleotide adenylyltransferase [Rossellomorea vietnamensis]|uniref:Probable nicotinate-nucleotide adenylyltransferase n=1 Tax=Rossellomorea vietnamensis TaxID=218284 RepID=A0A5D4MIL9_9BACI|nr:nicotinate-nucleotide adenylyltransferase [Rossellomorea vietnamensis]TYS00826.1 nicotinate-nucleotide adenylyltransferase [Rossellomorea vietnamensis]